MYIYMYMWARLVLGLVGRRELPHERVALPFPEWMHSRSIDDTVEVIRGNAPTSGALGILSIPCILKHYCVCPAAMSPGGLGPYP